jgi:hypothetical protein
MVFKMDNFYEILLASVLPITYLYSQLFLKIDSGTFSIVVICIGEVLLAMIINNKEKKKKNKQEKIEKIYKENIYK